MPQHLLYMQDEVTNFRPRGSDLDYPAKLQQQQEQDHQASSSTPSSDQAPLQAPLTNQNGNIPTASVPQQNTDSQVGAPVHLLHERKRMFMTGCILPQYPRPLIVA